MHNGSTLLMRCPNSLEQGNSLLKGKTVAAIVPHGAFGRCVTSWWGSSEPTSLMKWRKGKKWNGVHLPSDAPRSDRTDVFDPVWSGCDCGGRLSGTRGHQQNIWLSHRSSAFILLTLYYEGQINLTLTMPIHTYYHIISISICVKCLSISFYIAVQ